jgi:ubiquinone/menaquinone biosynthesis C-methylase UbiE
MKMTRLEKKFVNRSDKGAANAKRILAQLEPLALREGATVLELGCGIGDVGAFLARERGFQVLATDVDPAQISIARERHPTTPGLAFEVADAGGLRFAAEAFDLVVSQNVFHHIPAWSDAVVEIERVLRPGGHLLWLDLATPAALRWLLKPVASHAGLYTAAEIREGFRSAGLVERRVLELVRGFRYEMTLEKASLRRDR